MRTPSLVRLTCTVRDCGEELRLEGRRLECPRKHSFDLARDGYVNLLQVQDRKSSAPGDSKEAVAARRRLLDGGFGKPLLDPLLAMVEAIAPPAGGAVLDVGCGEGTFLAAVCARFGLDGHGVDISTPAIEAASRRHRDLGWVVANADRGLPFADGSFAIVMTIAGRRNASELRRVVAPPSAFAAGGRLVAAVPAEDDLREIRAALHGNATIVDRFGPLLTELEGRFKLEQRKVVRHTSTLASPVLLDLLAATYRGARRSQKEAIERLDAMDVTSSWTLCSFRPV
jgi:23S rRNA (guanine745-N1)-methyltransferase